jgi:hypothetical protein
MNHAMRQEHLALAERHVAQARRDVVCQRQIVGELIRDNHDTTEAQRLLVQFETALKAHIEDRDRWLRTDITKHLVAVRTGI